VEPMDHSKITTVVVAITIGLIGLGLIAYADIFERIKARQTTLGLHGTISN
jgi:hypothetical protein